MTIGDSADGSSDTGHSDADDLFNYLSEKIFKRLESLDDGNNKGIFGTIDKALRMMTPYGNLFREASKSALRIAGIADDLIEYKQNGTLRSWVLPSAAAQSFEVVYQSCVAYWLMNGPRAMMVTMPVNGDPADSIGWKQKLGNSKYQDRKVFAFDAEEFGTLKNNVIKFVNESVHAFVSSICREPPLNADLTT